MNSESTFPKSFEFRTDDRHVRQTVGILLLLGVAIAGAAAYTVDDWSVPLTLFAVFAVIAAGSYFYAACRVLRHRHVISHDGISSFVGNRLVRQVLWRDVEYIDQLQLRVVTRDRRHVSLHVPRTLSTSRPIAYALQ